MFEDSWLMFIKMCILVYCKHVKRLIIGDDLFGEIGEFKKFAKLVVTK